ncbi:MAG: zinc-ribbon domain-containing protein [Nostoc sp.]
MNCGASILVGDKFCEQCGAGITSKPPTVVNGCEKCGAGIDPEGYCSQCGFRQEQGERNWLEVIINSQL